MAISHGHAVLVSSAKGGSSFTERVECVFDSDPIKVGFNGKLLLTILSLCTSETIGLALAGPIQPMRIYNDDASDENLKMILMTLRV
jgi:DNA polymerase III sliding clamp (beta) subunit (PCNA family)